MSKETDVRTARFLLWAVLLGLSGMFYDLCLLSIFLSERLNGWLKLLKVNLLELEVMWDLFWYCCISC